MTQLENFVDIRDKFATFLKTFGEILFFADRKLEQRLLFHSLFYKTKFESHEPFSGEKLMMNSVC